MSESDIYRCLIQRDIYIDAIVFFSNIRCFMYLNKKSNNKVFNNSESLYSVISAFQNTFVYCILRPPTGSNIVGYYLPLPNLALFTMILYMAHHIQYRIILMKK